MSRSSHESDASPKPRESTVSICIKSTSSVLSAACALSSFRAVRSSRSRFKRRLITTPTRSHLRLILRFWLIALVSRTAAEEALAATSSGRTGVLVIGRRTALRLPFPLLLANLAMVDTKPFLAPRKPVLTLSNGWDLSKAAVAAAEDASEAESTTADPSRGLGPCSSRFGSWFCDPSMLCDPLPSFRRGCRCLPDLPCFFVRPCIFQRPEASSLSMVSE
mmetsp:Transcript_13569/g.31128  ORF Transcript_13569/g.31128 Transcript_13569/m.31128 type:complete len:220 (+) Transcript_13569:1384-2043(+)